GSRDHPFRAPDGGPARGRDRDRALRAALPPRGCATGETGDRRGNAGGMARDRRRPVARVHLLLAGGGGGRPAATADAKGKPPAWRLALLPLGLYPLWWIAKPRRGLRAVRARDDGRVAARSRLHRHNGRDSIRERREVSAIGVVRERRSASRDDEQLSSRH